MEKMYKLKEKLQKELDDISVKEKLTAGDLELAHKLTDTIKNIDKICMYAEEEGYSYDGGYGRGSIYANRGEHYVRGHYSRDGGMGRGRDSGNAYSSRRDSRGRYSRDDGRSEMMEHIEMAIDAAPDEYKEDFRRFMRQLERA